MFEFKNVITSDDVHKLNYKSSFTCKYNTKGNEISVSHVNIPEEITNKIVSFIGGAFGRASLFDNYF